MPSHKGSRAEYSLYLLEADLGVQIKDMYVSEQDIKLLSYLHAVKVATYQQIQRDIYPTYHLHSVCNRIYRLEANDFVQGFRRRLDAEGKRYISLTKNGFKSFVANGDERRIELQSEAVNHDLALVDIRSHLMKASKVCKVITENELQTWPDILLETPAFNLRYLNSDAVVEADFSSKIFFPLEYEASAKSKVRYEALLKRYYHRYRDFLVLYVCETNEILRKVSRLERQLYPGDKPLFFYALRQNLLADESCSFRNFNDYEIQLSNSKPIV
jgi:hypothetical protein